MSSTTTTRVTKKRPRNYAGPKSARRLFKRARVSPVRSNISIGRGPVPNNAMVTMRYTDNFSSTGAAMDYIFNLNSIFDPNRTGTGHQPLGRDQWVVFYQRYRVMTVRYTVLAVQDGSVNVVPHRVTILADNQAGGYTDALNAAEQHLAKTQSLTAYQSRSFTGLIKLWELTGIDKKAYTADDRYAAIYSSDPTEVLCLHVVHNQITGAAAALNALKFHVKLEMQCQLFDPFSVAPS